MQRENKEAKQQHLDRSDTPPISTPNLWQCNKQAEEYKLHPEERWVTYKRRHVIRRPLRVLQGGAVVGGHDRREGGGGHPQTSQELISCHPQQCGAGLNSCEAGCRWKMSRVLRAHINHWWSDTSEKVGERGVEWRGWSGARVERQQTANALVPCWDLTLRSESSPSYQERPKGFRHQ